MKYEESSEALGSVELSELNRVIVQEELFESLRPRPLMGLWYTLFVVIGGGFVVLFTDIGLGDDVVLVFLIAGFIAAPLTSLEESRKINKRIDVLHNLVKTKYCKNE